MTGSATEVAMHAASAAGGGESFILFGGDYSFSSVLSEMLKFFLFWLTGVAGGAAGGAGGSLFIPVLLSPLFDFYVYALPLSRAAVFGMAIAFTIQNARRGQQSPPPGYLSVFAWDVIVLMEPMSLLGTSVGVRINKMCPQWFIMVLMIGTLSYSAVETWKKALKRRSEEFKRDDSLADNNSTSNSVPNAADIPLVASWRAAPARQPSNFTLPLPAQQRSPLLMPSARGGESPLRQHAASLALAMSTSMPKMRLTGSAPNSRAASARNSATPSPSNTARVSGSMTNDKVEPDAVNSMPVVSEMQTLIPVPEVPDNHADLRMPISMMRCICSVGVCWALLLVLNIGLGGSGKYTRSGIECGSVKFYALWLLVPPSVILSVTIWNAMHMRASETKREALGLQLPREQIKWTTRNLIFYSSAFFFAGTIGALAGVGGSTIKGPLLIQFGLDPVIAQASSQFMLLTTISSTMIQYMALNMLPSGYGAVFFLLGLTSGTVGKAAMDWVVQQRRQTSLIVFALSLYTIAAVVSMSWISISQILEDWHKQRWDRFAFQHMCAALPSRKLILGKR